VEFLGIQPKEQVIQLIKNSRFLVLPSECYEGFPVTIAEAYACGKPVLGSKIGSLNELIEEDITGKKFLFGSTESLANSLNEMWKNTAQLSSMAKNARGAFEKKYNPDINIIMLNDIYSGVIDSARNKIAN
jgi:glycosyltransferase involved in cell wall biosynthesis